MTTSTLHDRAMLASLNISQWTNRKYDKSVSREVEAAHSAKDAGRYNKILVDKSALDPITKIAGAARQYHYTVTLPWGDNGERLLPAALFMDYAEQVRKYKGEFDQRVVEFIAKYPQLVQDARARLGSMYDAADFPDTSDIRSRFSIDTVFTPVPSANDFRVALNEEYVDKIKSEITSMIQDRQVSAVKDCWARVRDVVGKIHERLSNEENKFKDSLIENARELVSILPALNITGDPELAAIEADVRTLLVSPETLRADTGKRNETAARAADILSRMQHFA